MKFTDIKQLTSVGSYQINLPLVFLKKWVQESVNEQGLQLIPDFQRGYVWNEQQKSKYIEFLLSGGKSARIIYFNNPNWNFYNKDLSYTDFVCVDGLQRLSAALDFLDNKVAAFGLFYNEFEGKMPIEIDLLININNLKSKAEVLQWYIEMNSGGTVHSDSEIERVKKILKMEKGKKISKI